MGRLRIRYNGMIAGAGGGERAYGSGGWVISSPWARCSLRDALRMCRVAITVPMGTNQHTKEGTDNVSTRPRHGTDLAYTLDPLGRAHSPFRDRLMRVTIWSQARSSRAG